MGQFRLPDFLQILMVFGGTVPIDHISPLLNCALNRKFNQRMN